MFILLLVLSFSAAPPLHAEEEEIYFQSDYQQQVRDEEVLLLQGNVEVHFRQFVIYADEVRLNDAKDEFFGVGNVRVVGADRDIFADSVWYNYARDDFDMRNARGSMIVNNVSEPVWFEAERLKGNINDFKMINGRLTTCTPTEHREYHIEARSIKVLPNNKIIFRNGYMFLMNIPVLWFPYWAFSLAETPWTVEAGKESSSGVYVRTRYNYLDEELIIGTLIMEYYSQRGWRFGSEHQYLVERHGVGRINWLFTLGKYRNDTTGEVVHANEYSVDVNQPLLFGDRFKATVSFRASSRFNLAYGRTNDVTGSVSGSYKEPNGTTSVNLSGQTRSGASPSSSITTSLSHNRTIFGDVTSSGSIDYGVDKQGDRGAADETFNLRMQFNQSPQGRGWNWNARIESHWDPDGFTNSNDRNRSYIDKLPEINITFQPNAFPTKWRNILGFQMQNLNLCGALYYIGPENQERQGFYGRMDTRFTRNLRLSASHQIQSDVDFWQAISSTGDARYVYGTQVSWTWDMSKKIKWTTRWTRRDNEGRIPLSGFENAGTPSNQLAWNLNYQNGRLYTIRLSTGYQLRDQYASALLTIRRLSDLRLDLTYTPSNRFRLTMGTQYDFITRDIGEIRTQITMTDFRSYQVDSSLNFKFPADLTRIGATVLFVLGPDWDFKVTADYSPGVEGDILRDMQVTHRFDCTFLSFVYQVNNDMWGFTWGISAYPQVHLGYSTTERAFGPGFFNTFSGTGSGFSGGGFSLGGGGEWGGYGSNIPGGGYPSYGTY